MKKIIFMCLAFVSLSANAEIISMNQKESELFIDEMGLYRYKRGKDIYQKGCENIFAEAMKKKCMEAERAAWERGKTKEELKRDGTLYTGKIKVSSPKKKDAYFYVTEGEKGEQIDLVLNRYYFEKGLLYDIKTEEPFSGAIVIGGVEGLAPGNGKNPRFIVQQNYENGLPAEKPTVVPVE